MNTERTGSTGFAEEEQVRSLIAELFAAQLRRDLEGFLACCHPDIVYTFPGVNAVGGTYRGREGMREWWTRMGDAFAELTFALTHVFVDGAEAAIEWDDWGFNHDGSPYRSWGVTRITVNDGLIRAMRSMQDTEKLAELLPWRGRNEL